MKATTTGKSDRVYLIKKMRSSDEYSTTSPGIASVLLGGAIQIVFVLPKILWVADETRRSRNK
jgi:hypothetical protein